MVQTVMMIDDDEALLRELDEVLTSGGYRTVAVTDSRKAVGEAQKVRPDLILMDLKMPGKNGLELTFELRNKPGLADIPVIAMSGLFQDPQIPLLELGGIRKCLSKPVDPLDLMGAIGETLTRGPVGVDGSSGRSVSPVETHEKRLFLGRFEELLMEMAGEIDLPILSEMLAKLTKLKDYKECIDQSLFRPVFREDPGEMLSQHDATCAL